MNNVAAASLVTQHSNDVFTEDEQDLLVQQLHVEICQKKLDILGSLHQNRQAKLKIGDISAKFEVELTKIRTRHLKQFSSRLEQHEYIAADGKPVKINQDNKQSLEMKWRKKINGSIQQLDSEITISPHSDFGEISQKLAKKISWLSLNTIHEQEESEDDDNVQILSFYSETVTQAKEADLLFDILNHPENYVPSQLAGLPQKKLNPTIRSIDRAFLQAVRSYRKSFIEANKEDASKLNVVRDTSSDLSVAITTGVARYTLMTPATPIIREICVPFLGLAGAFHGLIYQASIIQEKVKIEQSASRIKWLEGVLTHEKMRVEQAIDSIRKRVFEIHQEIQSKMKKIYLHEDEIIVELTMLDSFYKFLSPATPLKLNQLSLSSYIFKLLCPKLEEEDEE